MSYFMVDRRRGRVTASNTNINGRNGLRRHRPRFSAHISQTPPLAQFGLRVPSPDPFPFKGSLAIWEAAWLEFRDGCFSGVIGR